MENKDPTEEETEPANMENWSCSGAGSKSSLVQQNPSGSAQMIPDREGDGGESFCEQEVDTRSEAERHEPRLSGEEQTFGSVLHQLLQQQKHKPGRRFKKKTLVRMAKLLVIAKGWDGSESEPRGRQETGNRKSSTDLSTEPAQDPGLNPTGSVSVQEETKIIKPASRGGTKTAEVSSDQTSATTETGFTVKEEPWTSLDGPELNQNLVGSMDHSMSGLQPAAEKPEPGPGLSLQPVVQHKPQQNVKKPKKKRLPVSLLEPTNQDKASLFQQEPRKTARNRTKPAENRTKASSRRGRGPTKTAEVSSNQSLATTGLGFTVKEEAWTSLDEAEPGLSFQPVVQHKPQQNIKKLKKKRLPVFLQEPTNEDDALLVQQEPQKTAKNRIKPAENRNKPASRRGRKPTKTAEAFLDQISATAVSGFTVKEEPLTSLVGPELNQDLVENTGRSISGLKPTAEKPEPGPGLSFQPVVQHKPQQNVKKPKKKRLPVSLEEPTNQDDGSLVNQEPQKTAKNRTKPAENRTKPASRRGRRATKTAKVSLYQTLTTTGLGFTVKEKPWTSLDGPEPGLGLSLQPVVQHKPQQNVKRPNKKRLPVSLDGSLVKQEPQKTAENRTKPASRRGRRGTKTAEVSSDQSLATTGLGFNVKEEPWTSLDGPELNQNQDLVRSMDHSMSGLQPAAEKPGPEMSLQPVVQHKPRENLKKLKKKRLPVSQEEPTNQAEASLVKQEPQKPAKNRTKPASRRGRRATKTAEVSSDQSLATKGLGLTVKEEMWTSLDGPELNQDMDLVENTGRSISGLQPTAEKPEPGPGLSFQPVVQHKPQQNVKKPKKKRLPVSLEEPTNQDDGSSVKQEPQKTAKSRTKPASRRGRRATKTAEASLDQTLATKETGFTVKEEPWTSLDGPGPELSFQPVFQHKPQQNVKKLKKKRLLVSLLEPTNQNEALLVKQEPQKTAENRTKPASRQGRKPTKTAKNQTKPAVRENLKKSPAQRSSKISQLKENVWRGATSLKQEEPTVESVKPRGPGRPRKTVLIKTEPVWDFEMNHLDFPSTDPKTPHPLAETRMKKPQKQNLKINSLYDTIKPVKEEMNSVPAELYGSDETAEGSVKKTRQRKVKRVKDDPTEPEEFLKRHLNHSGDKKMMISETQPIEAENTIKFKKVKKPSAARGRANRTVKAAPGKVSGNRKQKSPPSEFDEACPNSSLTRQEDVTERRRKRAKREPKKAVCNASETGPTLDQMKPELTPDLKETVSLDVNSKTSTPGVEKSRKRKRTSKKTSKGLELQVCPDWTRGHDATEDKRLYQTSDVKQRRDAFMIKMEEKSFPVMDLNIFQTKTDEVLTAAPAKTRARKRRGRTKTNQRDKKDISPLEVNASFFNQNLKIQPKAQNELREKRRPLQCSFCHRSFRHISAFNLHKRIHTGEKPYGCSVCTKRFSGRLQLLRHAKVHEGPAAVHCPCCDGAFRSKPDLIRHFKVHLSKAEGSKKEPEQNARTDSGSSSAEAFRCSVCSKEFRKKSTFKMHQRRHARRKFSRSVQEATSTSWRESSVVVTPTVFKCSICKQLHWRWCHYVLHLQLHVSGTSPRCDACGQSYDQSLNTPRHCLVCCRNSGEETACRGYLKNICKNRKDEERASSQESETPIVSSMRDSVPQTSDNLNLDSPMNDHLNLNVPKRDHLDLNTQTTHLLDLNTPKSDHLDLITQTNNHLDLYTPTNDDSDLEAPIDDDFDLEAPSPSSAFSPMSGQTAPRLSGLRIPRLGGRFLCGRMFPWNKLWLHHRRGGGMFRCNHCKLEFHFLGLYVRHLQEHAAQTTHTCPTDAFTDEEDLKTHVSFCNKRSDRLNCRTCGKRFSVWRNLKEHKLLHKGRRPYACRPCRRSFSCPASLTAHLQTHRKRLCVPQPARVDEPFLFPYRCRKCPGRFSSTDLLQAHQVCHFVAGKKPESSPETLVSLISRVPRVPPDLLPKKLPVSNKKHLFRYPHPDRLYVVPVISSEPPIIVSDTEEETRPESSEEFLQLQVLIQSLIPEKCQSDDEGSHDGEGRDNDEGSHDGEGRHDDKGSHDGEGRDNDEGSHDGEGRDDDKGSHDGEGRDDGAAAKYSNCELCSLIFKDVMSLHQHYREHARGMRGFC